MLEITGQSGANGTSELAEDGESFSEAVSQLKCGVKLTVEDAAMLRMQGPLASMDGDKRRFVRFACSARGILDCKQSLPSIVRQPRRFLVLIKNVSRSGICFLHEAQLYPHERCRMWMEARPPLTVAVARCRRLHEGCYEIGARFV